MCDYSRFFEKVKRFCALCHGLVLLFLSHNELISGDAANEDKADRAIGLILVGGITAYEFIMAKKEQNEAMA